MQLLFQGIYGRYKESVREFEKVSEAFRIVSGDSDSIEGISENFPWDFRVLYGVSKGLKVF